ncbi:MAG: tetratricopeptide repeat protein [Desulfobacterales bacterium]|nr:tetratricopeptide repeat protein [Desulfobacterales bacterium]
MRITTTRFVFSLVTGFFGLMLILFSDYINSPSIIEAQENLAQNQNQNQYPFLNEEIPDWKARWELAKVLSYLKRYKESIFEYEKLLKEKPDLIEAKCEMANVLFWNGEQDKAIAVFRQIPEEKLDDKSKLFIADAYVAQKNYDKAEPIYRSYLEKHPEDAKARLKLAEMLSWQKRYDESIAQYEMILKTVPNDIQIRRKYAFVLIWADKQTQAAEELKKTLK